MFNACECATISRNFFLFEEKPIFAHNYIKNHKYTCKIYVDENAQFTPWLATIDTISRRAVVKDSLRKHNIESAQVQYRNDRYSTFRVFVDKSFPNMDKIEDNYLVLPLHIKMTTTDVEKICEIVIDPMSGAV